METREREDPEIGIVNQTGKLNLDGFLLFSPVEVVQREEEGASGWAWWGGGTSHVPFTAQVAAPPAGLIQRQGGGMLRFKQLRWRLSPSRLTFDHFSLQITALSDEWLVSLHLPSGCSRGRRSVIKSEALTWCSNLEIRKSGLITSLPRDRIDSPWYLLGCLLPHVCSSDPHYLPRKTNSFNMSEQVCLWLQGHRGAFPDRWNHRLNHKQDFPTLTAEMKLLVSFCVWRLIWSELVEFQK